MRLRSPDCHLARPLRANARAVVRGVRVGSLRVVALVLAGVLVTSCGGAAPDVAAPTETARATAAARAATFTPEPTAVAAPSAGTEVPTMGDGMGGMYDYEATPTPPPTIAAPDYDALPAAAGTQPGLIQQFLMIDAALRDPETSAVKLAYMGHLQQLALGRLADYPEWKDTVLAGLNPTARSFVAGSFEAGKQLRSMSNSIPTRLPDWRIVAAAPITELMGYYKEAEATFGVPWPYLAGIHLVETRMGPIRRPSSAGAQGPMQFMPATSAQ